MNGSTFLIQSDRELVERTEQPYAAELSQRLRNVAASSVE